MGTILTALELGKPLLVMPRRAALGEHRNDHQLATVRRFAELGSVEVALDESELALKLDDLAPAHRSARDQPVRAGRVRRGGPRIHHRAALGASGGRARHRARTAYGSPAAPSRGLAPVAGRRPATTSPAPPHRLPVASAPLARAAGMHSASRDRHAAGRDESRTWAVGGFIRSTQHDRVFVLIGGLWCVSGLAVGFSWTRLSVGWSRRGFWGVSGLSRSQMRSGSRCGRRSGFGSRRCWCVGGLSIRRIVCRLRSGSGSWSGSRGVSPTRRSRGFWVGLGQRSAGRSGGRVGGGVSIGRRGPSGGRTGTPDGRRSASSSGARGC